MKTAPQHSADLAHVAGLIKDIPIAMLTNIQGDGNLASRPMAALEMDADGAIWFFTDLRSEKVEHLRAVGLAFIDGAHGTYVSLSGRGEIDTDPGRIERLWTALARPWFPDGPDAPSLALLKFVPEAADYWDAPHSKMVRGFGVLASVLAGKPIAMGEQGSHKKLSAVAAAAL